jgi:hypothetical protein
MTRNTDEDRFKAGIGTQIRKIYSVRLPIETQVRKGIRLTRNRNVDDERSKAEYK